MKKPSARVKKPLTQGPKLPLQRPHRGAIPRHLKGKEENGHDAKVVDTGVTTRKRAAEKVIKEGPPPKSAKAAEEGREELQATSFKQPPIKVSPPNDSALDPSANKAAVPVLRAKEGEKKKDESSDKAAVPVLRAKEGEKKKDEEEDTVPPLDNEKALDGKENNAAVNSPRKDATKASDTEGTEETGTRNLVNEFQFEFDAAMISALLGAIKEQPGIQVTKLIATATDKLSKVKLTPVEDLMAKRKELEEKLKEEENEKKTMIKQAAKYNSELSANPNYSTVVELIGNLTTELKDLDERHEKEKQDAITSLKEEYIEDYRKIIGKIQATWTKHNKGDTTVPSFIEDANKKWEAFWGNSSNLMK